MHALILMTVLAQWAPREAPHYGHVRESRRMGNRSLVGQGYAFFEAFPASGAGTTSACSTTAPTGAKGETLTFTRTGNATCSKKGLASTGIADGDLVVMSGNVARVEPDADGVLGLRVEGSRQNVILRSQEFDNASWSKTAVAPLSAVGVWPNDAGAPDGTQTADAVHFEATASGQASRMFQGLATGISIGCAVYAKGARPMDGGVPQSGQIDVYIDLSSGGFVCSQCSYSADSWTRCIPGGGAVSGGTGNFLIGNDSRAITCNNGPRTQQDVLLWQADCHSGGTYVTSPIPTVAAAVTRNAESAYFTIAPGAHTNYSMAATASVGKVAGTNWSVLTLAAGAAAPYRANYSDGSNGKCESYNATPLLAVRAPYGSFINKRIACYNDGNERGIYDGTAFPTPSAADTRSINPTRAYIGQSFAAGYEIDGIVSKVCFEPNDPTRCR